VLGVLLYAVETWSIKQRELVHSLEVFHDHCLRTILGMSRAQQIKQHISNKDVQHRMNIPVALSDAIWVVTSKLISTWIGEIGQRSILILVKMTGMC